MNIDAFKLSPRKCKAPTIPVISQLNWVAHQSQMALTFAMIGSVWVKCIHCPQMFIRRADYRRLNAGTSAYPPCSETCDNIGDVMGNPAHTQWD